VIQFLIDEDVTPKLREVANARGYNAYHVQYLDWKGRKDHEIRRRMLEEDLTLVTGNWRDFRPMLKRENVHPGAISLPDVPRAQRVRLFEAALDSIEFSEPPTRYDQLRPRRQRSRGSRGLPGSLMEHRFRSASVSNQSCSRVTAANWSARCRSKFSPSRWLHSQF
jgi:predicted nuclease of predicted toxin-antitoxin system